MKDASSNSRSPNQLRRSSASSHATDSTRRLVATPSRAWKLSNNTVALRARSCYARQITSPPARSTLDYRHLARLRPPQLLESSRSVASTRVGLDLPGSSSRNSNSFLDLQLTHLVLSQHPQPNLTWPKPLDTRIDTLSQKTPPACDR